MTVLERRLPILLDPAQVTQTRLGRLGYVVQDGMPVKTNLNDLYCDGSMWAPHYPNPNSPNTSAVLP